jgi:hypothetical protein
VSASHDGIPVVEEEPMLAEVAVAPGRASGFFACATS